MFDPAEVVSGYERSPADLLRLLVALVAAVTVALLTKLIADTVGGLQDDFVNLLAVASAELVRVLEGLLSLIALVLVVLTLAIPLLTRRLRIFGYVLVANLLCGLSMAAIDAWLNIGGATNDSVVNVSGSTELLPDATAIAQSAAVIVVFAPFVTRRWRQMLWSLFGVMLVLQVLISVHPPGATVIALTVGPAVGSATLLAFGRPMSLPSPSAIIASLRSAGLRIADIEAASVDARGSTPYFATMPDGSRLFVKVLGANERAADLMFRMYRRLRLRNVGDERPDSSLRRTVEHEALVSLQARDVGISTPRMRAVARVGQDSFLLAYDLIPGSSLDSVPHDRLDDAVLAGLWDQVGLLRAHRIAHRDLRLANVFLDDDDTPWIIDFGFSEVAADDTLLHADVAQLLASLSVSVGAERATTSAISALGADAVAEAAPRLQLVALSGATQSALKEQNGLLEELRDEVTRQCGIDPPTLDPLTRFRPSTGALLAATAAVLYVGLPALVGFDEVSNVLSGADWAHLASLVVAALFIELSHGWSLYSSVPMTLPALPTLVASTASVFASTTAPAQLGGTSLRVRYLEHHGLSAFRAAAATAFGGVVNGFVVVGLLLAFALWAGGASFEAGEVAHPRSVWIGLGILACVALLSFAIPAVRRRVVRAAAQAGTLARAGLHQLSGTPSRVVTTVAAGFALALAHLAALDAAMAVFNQPLDLATLGVVYLAATALASLVPTPGHLGALEAMLVAGLMTAGVGTAAAVCVVLLYRLASFWLPVAFGWAGFRWLHHYDHV